LGGIVLPSFSESYGRKWLYFGSAVFYSAFSVLIATWRTVPGVVLGRFVTGLVSAVPSVVITGSIEDLWDIRARVWIFFFGATVCNMALVLGPIISPYIIAAYGWQWVFYISAIVSAIVAVLLAFIRESRPSIVLHRIVEQLRADYGDAARVLTTTGPDDTPDLGRFLQTGVARPLHLLFTEWVTITVSLLAGVAFGLIYLFTETMPQIFDAYRPPLSETEKIVPWFCLAAGFLLSGFTRVWDHWRLRNHRTADITPEDKLLGFVLAAPALAIGLWWFAWTIPSSGISGTQWSVPWPCAAGSLVLVGWALNEFDIVLGGYITDAYQSYAGSAFGAMSLVRSVLSATFPLLGSPLYNGLGYHWAGTLLAALATVFCIVPWVFTVYGAKLRAKSRFAAWVSSGENDDLDE
jgi:hypothetical protein